MPAVEDDMCTLALTSCKTSIWRNSILKHNYTNGSEERNGLGGNDCE